MHFDAKDIGVCGATRIPQRDGSIPVCLAGLESLSGDLKSFGGKVHIHIGPCSAGHQPQFGLPGDGNTCLCIRICCCFGIAGTAGIPDGLIDTDKRL